LPKGGYVELEADVSSLSTGTGTIPRIKLQEQGFTGLQVSNGQILEQARRELRFPQSVKTFRKMSADSTIKAALGMFELMISRVKWTVAPTGETELEMAKAKFVEQCMNDMEHSWFNFIKEVVSMYTFGFCVNEKVFRRRYKNQGSKYNDGLMGLRKLPIRSQDSVYRWQFSDDGRDLIGVEQQLSTLNAARYAPDMYKGKIEIPRKSFMLFRTDVAKDNPEGTSPLVGCYTAWKFRTQLEEIEAVGYSRNMGGVPHLELHPKYMAEDASVADKAVYSMYQKIITNLHNNEQAGLITPLMYDPETKMPYFKFSLLSVQNSGSQYIDTAIRRYDDKILTVLFCDVLSLGKDNVGSFSLADSKTNLLSMAVEARLQEIQDVLNQDLIPDLFRRNGWDDEEFPKFVYGDIEEADLEVMSKAIQRLAATGLIAKTPENVNAIAEMVDLPYRIDANTTQEELDTILGAATSKSGEGFKSPSGEGTRKNTVAANNTSDLNTENAA